MGKTPAVDDDAGARPEDVKAGKTFWGLRSDGWGLLTGTGTVEGGSETTCGAYVAPDVWKEFDCYNLAAIGKITGADPFTPSWELNGGYWQWGRKGPDPVNWYNTNTPNFAHGPTGPGETESNNGEISGWDLTVAPNGAWSESQKTANDPCPAGYRVPTRAQWDGIQKNNTQSTVGNWSSSATDPVNYSAARFFGSKLMLPAAGHRHNEISGALWIRGFYGYYWSCSEVYSAYAQKLDFSNDTSSVTGSKTRTHGLSIRCIAESDDPTSCTYSLSSSSGTFTLSGGSRSLTISVSSEDCTWTIDNGLSWVSLFPESGIGSGDVTLSVTPNTGAARTGSITIAGHAYSISQDEGSPCGAFIATGIWKEFDCYNLAAIGKTTNDDPFTPSWRLVGGYWQWGRKGPDPSQWYDTNSVNFAHGPTGPGESEANSDSINGWATSSAPDGAWSDESKTTNDPCPAGYRIPTKSDWEGVLDTNNNPQNLVGTWTSSATNYTSARKFGNALMLPTVGYRDYDGGALQSRGGSGYYWSSSEALSPYAWASNFGSGDAKTNGLYRRIGYSVRCILE
jgi:uncharacterized protein (TIGR02145 family)